MSDISLIVENASRLFRDNCGDDVYRVAEEGRLSQPLWAAIRETGLPDAARSDARGGPGTNLQDALAIVREAGAHSVPAPLAETMLAEIALEAACLPPRPGIGTIGPVVTHDVLTLDRRGDSWILTGTAHRVPWARVADYVVLIGQFENAPATVVAPPPKNLQHGRNFAHEPRDTLVFDGLRIPAADVAPAPHGLTLQELRLYGALFRLVASAGAMGTLLDMTLRYAQERQQFGRRIGQFQAVQHLIAVLASQIAAANAAADGVAALVGHGLPHFDVAAAKARVSEAAGVAAGIAHQVHGAMGFTLEHPLHRLTRRLWSWRDEFGSDHEWSTWIGKVTVKLGAEGLWSFLTSEQKALPS